MNTLLSDIIKYQNIEDVVMARHPVEKVYSNTRVQVMEGHEAVIEIEKSLSGPYGEGEHVIFDDAEGFYTDILYRIQKQHPYSLL